MAEIVPVSAFIRDVQDSDISAILELNEEFVEYLAPMDAEECAEYRQSAAYFRVIEEGGELAGFLIAYRPGANYESDNYSWFSEQYDDFAYVDRIVIAAGHQGKQFGRLFYDDVQAFAKEQGLKRITCEYNSEPLNEGSKKFHAAYGFEEVGRQWLNDGNKQVSLQSYAIASA